MYIEPRSLDKATPSLVLCKVYGVATELENMEKRYIRMTG